MNLRTLMQTGPARANELFGRLGETSDGAVKTREKLFAELKAELELHTRLEEEHLFPLLRRNAQKELVADAMRDNRELMAKLGELEALPKNDESFLPRLKEMQKAFRQHARDEKTEILPAVQQALSEGQVQDVAEKIEAGRAEAEQARQDEAEERRNKARQEREQAELQAQQAEAAERERREAERQKARQEREQAELQAKQAEAVERQRREVERQAREAERQTRETARLAAEATLKPVAVAADITREAARIAKDAARVQTRQVTAARNAAMPFAELFLWPWAGAMQSMQPRTERSGGSNEVTARSPQQGAEEVIPLGEEVLEVSKRSVNRGTARIRRYVVETPVEKLVTLQSERVVVERRRAIGQTPNGEVLTEVTVEVVETEEVPVVEKRVQLREEIVVRTERAQRVETVRETVRHDEVEIQQPTRKRQQHLRAIEASQD